MAALSKDIAGIPSKKRTLFSLSNKGKFSSNVTFVPRSRRGVAPPLTCVRFSSPILSFGFLSKLGLEIRLQVVMGPREITAGSRGIYIDNDIGTDIINRDEKLPKPASTVTSSIRAGTILSHSLKRSSASSLGRKVSFSRIAKDILGAFESREVGPGSLEPWFRPSVFGMN
jgi:hypothetical protein